MSIPPLRTLFKTLLLLLGLLLCWWTLRTLQIGDIGSTLQRLTPTSIVILVLANLGVLITLCGRWWLFLYGQGYAVPFWRLLSYRVAAFAVSYFTPGPHFGGEPLQVYLVSKRHDVPTAVSIAAVTLDKLLEMTINFTVLTAAVILVLSQQVLTDALAQRTLYTALGLLLAPLSLLALLWSGRYSLSSLLTTLGRQHPFCTLPTVPMILSKVQSWGETIRQSEAQVVALWRTAPLIFLAAWLVSLISWGALIGEFWYMTHALGLGLSFTQALTLLLAMRIAILLPMPAGLGALEASLAMAMAALSFNPTAGIGLSLLIRLRDVLLGSIGLWLGGITLWRQTAPTAPADPLALKQAGPQSTQVIKNYQGIKS